MRTSRPRRFATGETASARCASQYATRHFDGIQSVPRQGSRRLSTQRRRSSSHIRRVARGVDGRRVRQGDAASFRAQQALPLGAAQCSSSWGQDRRAGRRLGVTERPSSRSRSPNRRSQVPRYGWHHGWPSDERRPDAYESSRAAQVPHVRDRGWYDYARDIDPRSIPRDRVPRGGDWRVAFTCYQAEGNQASGQGTGAPLGHHGVARAADHDAPSSTPQSSG